MGRAMVHFRRALRFYTPEAAPLDYAIAQNNLGSANLNLQTGDHTANLKRAIACYWQALRFRTVEFAPLDHAMTQNSLGLAYLELLTGNRAENLERAIACYQQALRFYTHEASPFNCRGTNRMPTDLYFAQREWPAALRAYCAAMEAGERLYRTGLTAKSKAAEIAENIVLYRNAAFSGTSCGETTEALLALERGKTRLLAEALHLRIPRPANVPDEVWMAFEDAGAAVR
jgi:tetratricopeptide (TPR) repeat protein